MLRKSSLLFLLFLNHFIRMIELWAVPRPPALRAWNLGDRSPGKSQDFAILGIRYEPSTLQVSLSPLRIARSSLENPMDGGAC